MIYSSNAFNNNPAPFFCCTTAGKETKHPQIEDIVTQRLEQRRQNNYSDAVFSELLKPTLYEAADQVVLHSLLLGKAGFWPSDS